MSTMLRICKNDKCTEVVPKSLNPGAERLYHSTRCRRQFLARQSYQKEVGFTGSSLINVIEGYPHIARQMPGSAKAAHDRFIKHLDACPISETGGMCPARSDVYDRRRICLIHAIFNDDWGQLMAAEDGIPYTRKTTSEDGYWLDDRASLAAGGQVPVIPVPKQREEYTPKKVDVSEFVAAGGGKPDAPILRP